jgi:outer membrane immunogenic protein
MRRLSVALIAAAFTIALTQIASAADMAVKAPRYAPAPVAPAIYNWNGWFIGGNIGYGWGEDTGGLWDSFTDPHGGPSIFGTAEYFGDGGNVLPGVRPNGIIGGGQIGYNWQVAPNWVWGVVADIQGSDMHDSATASVFTPTSQNAQSFQSNSSKIEWFGTARGRVGYAANNWLFYGSGGLAYGGVKTTVSLLCTGTCAPPNILYAGTNSAVNAGWAAGAGVEVGLTPNWTAGVEYLHIDLGDISTTATFVSTTGVKALAATAATFTANSTFVADIVRGTVNYKF